MHICTEAKQYALESGDRVFDVGIGSMRVFVG